MKKLWGGRFKSELASEAKCFSYSLSTDFELFDADIELSIAWAKALAQAKVLTSAEKSKIIRGLGAVRKKFVKFSNPHQHDPAFGELCAMYEDVHSLIQAELEKSVGAVAKKLHTGRSRNDQVTTATRIWLKKYIPLFIKKISGLQTALVGFAEKNQSVLIPGYTHLQRAQVISVAQPMLAYTEMLERDKERFQDALGRADALPLGSGAIGGSTVPVSREFLRRELGFAKILDNSMDATADRDYVIEVLSAAATLMMHVSRLSEDMILWNTSEFGFLHLDDAYSTGSSLMPQKKNPDMFELARGRSGRAFGYLVAALVNQKGLPLAYNRDLQEDKVALFASLKTCSITLNVLKGAIATAKIKEDACHLAAKDSFLYATDVLDYLVSKKMSFADAHEAVGKIVRYALEENIELNEVPLSVIQKIHPPVGELYYKIFSPKVSVTKKKTTGSTSPASVRAQILKWKRVLK
ncbi:MAG: argininosuccinate lyase [Candidatus Omnitrophica bacterium]|nr:argininosuccinate lyase [Candidatus Omnitrophota bacterium]